MVNKNLQVEREAARLTTRLHLPTGTWFGRYRLVAEHENGQRSLVRVCRLEAELTACLRSLIRDRRQARRERGLKVELAGLDGRRQGPWFVAQQWVGCAFKGAWRDLATSDLPVRHRAE
jgi:hypothetical protein